MILYSLHSEMASVHARPLSCVSQALFLALLAHASPAPVTAAVARVLAAHPAHAALHEGYAAAAAWLEPELRWSAHTHKQWRAEVEAVAAATKAEPAPGSATPSATEPLKTEALKTDDAVKSDPEKGDNAAKGDGVVKSKATVKSRLQELMRRCLSPAQSATFLALLRELSAFKGAAANDARAQEQSQATVDRFRALFEGVSGSWELATTMLEQMPPVCRTRWASMAAALPK